MCVSVSVSVSATNPNVSVSVCQKIHNLRTALRILLLFCTMAERDDRKVTKLDLKIPYRTKIRRTKVSKFHLGVENFVRRNILSVENFVQYFNTKVRQKSDKTVEI